MKQIRAFTNGGWQLILLFTRFYASQVVQEFFYPQYQSPWYNLHMWQLREATNWPHSMSYHHPAFHTTQLEHILYIYIYSCLCLGFDVLHRTQLAPVFQVPNSGVFVGHWPSPRDPKVQGSWKAPKMRTPPSAGNEKNDTPQLFGYRNPKPKDCSVWGFFKLGILDKSLQKLKFKWQLEWKIGMYIPFFWD